MSLLQPSDLTGDLPALRIGQPVTAWFQEEIGRLRDSVGPDAPTAGVEDWAAFERGFLKPA